MKRAKKIRVIKVPIGMPPFVDEIENSLETMQQMVGGYLEGVRLIRSIFLMCNEEGKLQQLPPNRHVAGYGLIVGDFFITRCNKAGDNISLTDADVQDVMKVLY